MSKSNLQPILLDGRWVAANAPTGSFRAFDPSQKLEIDSHDFPVSGWEDLDAMLEAGKRAAAELARLPGERIAQFLEAFAAGIEARAEALIESAHRETGLPVEPRLRKAELPRTTGQLRQAAQAARDGSWARPTIDTANNLRSMHAPLGGPVVVFGPNNFPFAFNGVSGGDFAAAIAAGNPVIAKAHPAHPHTSLLLAQAAAEAVQASGLPSGTVQMFFHTSNELGLRLVTDPRTAAIAFTGSRPAGMAIKAAADAAGKPAYLEMSSVNPVFILAGALRERGAAIAAELASSCAMGAGQFCTRPGIAVLPPGEHTDAFVQELQRLTAATPAGVLLTPRAPEAVAEAVAALRAAGAELLAGGGIAEEAAGYAFQPTLLRVSGKRFLEAPHELQNEAFGQVCLLVLAESEEQMLQVAHALEGNLTGTIYSDTAGSDDAQYDVIAPVLRTRVGRLINDRMPTGVAVSPAQNHGGPYPATGHPAFTAVGIPASLLRFSALHSYDNVRPHRLPPALRDANPTGTLWRLVDGKWTTADA
ncbi:aldehyde dehydrogenase family protein [Pseudoxanthomonas sp. SGNA-20]|uniref:NADP-dependent aldehyde dehydrogenase n=1 Tax=Pseudoxanthomonas taiwanensis J19 TaxID=935569 RepID=A0A562D5Q5_9GAMM|nr:MULTISPECIES: aldehyde dehydrogenase family protein [Pseudoxanthomonas]RRN55476.1 aldehyde dehydrogenase family protein [Pseudoxanthomonas sp. SGNA-20]TWH05086.1 NADP-dependent aldehyde dehydrogenase [Pseudoxanthomonas taiwanensis J19]